MAIAKRSRTELATQRFDYAPAPESTDHVKIEKRYDLFIGGRMVKAHNQKRFPTINPATEEKLSQVVEAYTVDGDRAVKTASKAFDSWSRIGPSRRARYLFRISRILQERARACGRRDAGRRQADQGIARCRYTAQRGPLFLLHTLCRQAREGA